MIVEVSQNDVLSSKLPSPGWYRVVIDAVEDKMSKDNASTNSWLKGRIICNADTGDKEFEGVPTPFLWLINSKGLFAHLGLFIACGFEGADKPGARLDTQALAGKVVEMFIGNAINPNTGMMQSSAPGMYRKAKAA